MAGFDLLRMLVLRRYWSLTRGMLLGARGAVIDGGGHVLLIRHSYTPGWYLPGGGVERGETLRDALDRELAEEGRVEATSEPDLFGIYSNEASLKGDHVALFVLRDWRSLGPFTPNREIVDHGFFPPDALPDGTTPGTRRRIGEIFFAAARSRTW